MWTVETGNHPKWKKVRGGEYYLWLPGGNTLNRGTGFYEPRAYGTLTIPATARRVIAVGAYDSLVDSYADFPEGAAECCHI